MQKTSNSTLTRPKGQSELGRLKQQLYQVRQLIADVMVKLDMAHISLEERFITDDAFMSMIGPLYDNGLGELVESVEIDEIRAYLTGKRK